MKWLPFLLLTACGAATVDDPEPTPEAQTCIGSVSTVLCSEGAQHPDCWRCPGGMLVRECEGSEYVETCKEGR